jgi:hypothetical protein
VSNPQDVLAEAEQEILLTLEEFGYWFNRTRAGLSRCATRGRLPGAVKIAGAWYVLVPERLVRAAKATKKSGLSKTA